MYLQFAKGVEWPIRWGPHNTSALSRLDLEPKRAQILQSCPLQGLLDPHRIEPMAQQGVAQNRRPLTDLAQLHLEFLCTGLEHLTGGVIDAHRVHRRKRRRLGARTPRDEQGAQDG